MRSNGLKGPRGYAFIIKILLAIFLLIGPVQCRRAEKKAKSVLLTKVAKMIKDKCRRQSQFNYKDINAFLRNIPEDGGEEDPANLQNKDATLVEKELISALAHKKSALLDKPYIETQGRNDFLVLHPSFRDPFVTIIPNMMYYNIEKKCVNWLDDCNLHGMKARLLREVQSPYKK